MVVTALGFKEKKFKQGTSIASVGGDVVAESGENTLIAGLQGKVAGVRITSASGSPGAGSRIVIRGTRTLGNNQPLIVIDGVPVSNTSFGSTEQAVVQQSRLNDIDPDNIKSVTVLKGAQAAATWGSRGANGVIMITTKTGSYNSGLNISIGSQVKLSHVNKMPPLQTKFGEGRHGHFVWGYTRSWGDKIADREGGNDLYVKDFGQYYDCNNLNPGCDLYEGFATDKYGNKYYVIPDGGDYTASGKRLGPHGGKRSRQTYDHGSGVFGLGVGLKNSISISGGGDKSRFYISASRLKQNGVAKYHSNYRRTNFRVNVNRKFNDWIKANVNVAYININSDRVQNGVNVTGLMLGTLRTPPGFNNKIYLINYTNPEGNTFQNIQRSYRDPIGSDRFFSALVGPSDAYVADPGFDNPIWSSRFELNNSLVNRVVGSTEIKITPLSWLSVTERIGLNYFVDKRYQYRPQGNAADPGGSLKQSLRNRIQINSDLIARAKGAISENISGSVLLGWNLNSRSGQILNVNGFGMVFRNVPMDVQNFKHQISSQDNFIERTAAYYGKLNINLFDQLYLQFTGRNESASTFGVNAKSSFFYPSASVAWQFTDLSLFEDKAPFLDFGKLRFSYGESGIQPDPYLTNTHYIPAIYGDPNFGSTINSSQYGSGFSRSARKGNPTLGPAKVTQYGFGADLTFLDNRLKLSFTRYHSRSNDVIINVNIAPSSGFTSRVINSVQMKNDGYELSLTSNWIANRKFSWSTRINWTKNTNVVTDLAGANSVDLGGLSVDSRAVEGYPLGVIYGGHWIHSSDGSLLVNNGTTFPNEPIGFPVQAPTDGPVGNPHPDWQAGITNIFHYKDFALSFLIDIKKGGELWNGTLGVLYSYGTTKFSAVETFVPSNKAGQILNYNGVPVSQFGTPTTQNGVDGFVFRGRLKDWDGSGPAPTVALDEAFYRSGPGNHYNGPASQFVEDAGWVRLRNVTLSYKLNGKWLRSSTGLSSIDFRVTANNVLLFTPYSGIDPETSLEGTSNAIGLDYFNNPNTRSILFSIEINY